MGKRVYSLGLYIHECPKMRYKGTFKPSFLLCHESRKFVEFSLAKPCLEEHAMRLLPHGEIQWLSQREEEEEKEKMLLVFVYEERTVMTYKQAVEKYGEAVEKKLKEYLPLLSPPPPSSVFIITLEWIVCARDIRWREECYGYSIMLSFSELWIFLIYSFSINTSNKHISRINLISRMVANNHNNKHKMSYPFIASTLPPLHSHPRLSHPHPDFLSFPFATNTPHFITITRRALVPPCGQSHVYRSFPSIFSHQTYQESSSKISISDPSPPGYILLIHSTLHPASLFTHPVLLRNHHHVHAISNLRYPNPHNRHELHDFHRDRELPVTIIIIRIKIVLPPRSLYPP